MPSAAGLLPIAAGTAAPSQDSLLPTSPLPVPYLTVACGPMVPEAMRAAWILKREYGFETRILNLHTLKPIDQPAIVWAAKQTGVVVTAEEHR